MQISPSIPHYVSAETPPSPPMNLRVTATTATSIAVTWEHPGGLVDRYELTYRYIINECGNNMRDPPVIVTLNSSQSSYTIENGPSTPVEEDSDYSISLVAINSAGRSSSDSDLATTPEAGMILYYFTCYMCIAYKSCKQSLICQL